MSWLFSRKMMEDYGNCLCSAAPGAESSAESCSGGGQSAASSVMPTLHQFLYNDKTMDISTHSLFGPMYAVLTDALGEAVLTSFRADFLAKTFPPQEKVSESREKDRDCGSRWQGSSARYDLATHSWKTAQCLWEEDLPWSSVILPKWGMMRGGALSERITPGLLTSEIESGFWPTPVSKMSQRQTIYGENRSHTTGQKFGLSLIQAVRMWPTPTSSEHKYRLTGDSQQSKSLGAMMRKEALCAELAETTDGASPAKAQQTPALNTYPTPKTNGFCGGSGAAAKVQENENLTNEEKRSMLAGDGGRLNPDWVEWLMNWPVGWTRLEPIEMDWRDWSVDPAETGEAPRIANNTPNRVARLKAIGNGQVPAAMVLAWRVLMDDLRTALKL